MRTAYYIQSQGGLALKFAPRLKRLGEHLCFALLWFWREKPQLSFGKVNGHGGRKNWYEMKTNPSRELFSKTRSQTYKYFARNINYSRPMLNYQHGALIIHHDDNFRRKKLEVSSTKVARRLWRSHFFSMRFFFLAREEARLSPEHGLKFCG